MTHKLIIRDAQLEDASHLVEFNLRMAAETEGRQLDRDVLADGVHTALHDPALGFYVVAQVDDHVAGGLLVTREWSDWRNGFYWWVQSVYVVPEFRRRGLYRRLYQFVQQRACEAGNVRGIRLYVERHNHAAQAAYRALGMADAGYHVYEEMLALRLTALVPPDRATVAGGPAPA